MFKYKNIIIALLLASLISMIVITTMASVEEGVFEALIRLWDEIWFKATILDFYINQLIIWGFICWYEKNLVKSLLWLILCLCFGSMASAFYLIIKFLQVRKSEV